MLCWLSTYATAAKVVPLRHEPHTYTIYFKIYQMLLNVIKYSSNYFYIFADFKWSIYVTFTAIFPLSLDKKCYRYWVSDLSVIMFYKFHSSHKKRDR